MKMQGPFPSPWESSRPRDQTCVSCISCIRRWVLYHWGFPCLKLQYYGHLMQRVDSLEKTLILGKIEGSPVPECAPDRGDAPALSCRPPAQFSVYRIVRSLVLLILTKQPLVHTFVAPPRPEGWPHLPGAHSPCSQEEKAPRHV